MLIIWEQSNRKSLYGQYLSGSHGKFFLVDNWTPAMRTITRFHSILYLNYKGFVIRAELLFKTLYIYKDLIQFN